MKLLVDADSCPAAARTIIQKRAAKENIPLVFAANRSIPFDIPYRRLVKCGLFTMEICPAVEGAADDRLTALAESGDIAITRDIPLASRLIAKGIHTLDDRGRIFTEDNIRYHLSLRDLNIALAEQNDPFRTAAYGEKEKKAFADSLDRLLTSLAR
jgi:uncharacterized protein YaiI (UPF0178 family)